MGHSHAGHAGESLAFAFSTPFQTGNGNESASIFARAALPKSRRAAGDDVHVAERDRGIDRSRFSDAFHEGFQRATRNHAARVSHRRAVGGVEVEDEAHATKTLATFVTK